MIHKRTATYIRINRIEQMEFSTTMLDADSNVEYTQTVTITYRLDDGSSTPYEVSGKVKYAWFGNQPKTRKMTDFDAYLMLLAQRGLAE